MGAGAPGCGSPRGKWARAGEKVAVWLIGADPYGNTTRTIYMRGLPMSIHDEYDSLLYGRFGGVFLALANPKLSIPLGETHRTGPCPGAATPRADCSVIDLGAFRCSTDVTSPGVGDFFAGVRAAAGLSVFHFDLLGRLPAPFGVTARLR
jgi:hypothetical protein